MPIVEKGKVVNLGKLRKNVRGPKQKSGRKRHRDIHYDILPAPDSKAGKKDITENLNISFDYLSLLIHATHF